MKKIKKDFYQVSLKLILNNKKGETLVLKDWPNGTFKGKFDLPGGRIDNNEFEKPIEKIIAREVKEEMTKGDSPRENGGGRPCWVRG